jgi:hypothetical protein
MDPNACWKELEDVNTAMWGIAIERAASLLEWLAKDGFPPIIGGRPIFDLLIASATCEAIAGWVM